MGQPTMSRIFINIGRRIGTNHVLGERGVLDQEEPVPIGAGKSICRIRIHLAGGRDIQKHHLRDVIRIIKPKAVRNTCATIMGKNGKTLVTKMGHQPHHVPRHRAFRIGRVIRR